MTWLGYWQELAIASTGISLTESDRALCDIQPRAAEAPENHQSFNPLQWLQQWWMGATTPAPKT